VILLLDAHAVLWWLTADTALAPEARSAIADPANEVVVSAASVWELEIKRASGKLRPPEAILAALDAEEFSVLPITGTDPERAGGLPLHHRDPFDRMLVAQAARIGATIVTKDRAFAAYEVDVLPA
jgi:PIN domain nuclease of toxin-antitoxin system